MRNIILAGAAVLVIGGAAAGVAVNKAGAQTDPEALQIALAEPPQGIAQAGQPAGDVDEMADLDPMVLAQAGPPGGPGAPPPPPPPLPPPAPGMAGRPMPGPRPGWGGRPMWHGNLFGLFYRKDDKQLTTADVQKIAEAFLLWQGNRDWKVTQVTAGPDGKIGFAFATSEGGVIARFTMDSKNGHLARVG